MSIRTAEQKALTNLKSSTLAYLDKWKTNGGLIGGFFCPCCNAPQSTTIPRKKDTSNGYWDSLTTCYECGGLFMSIRYVGGKIEAIKPDLI